MDILIPSLIPSSPGKVNLAGFDLDNTLITSSRGVPFDTSEHWVFLGNIPGYFKQFEKDWVVCIFTNQTHYTEENQIRIRSVFSTLERINGWAPFIMVGIAKENKKPSPVLFHKLLEILTEKGYTIEGGFYCGDACGREDPFPPYQWGDDDKMFALNIGMTFYRPVDLMGRGEPKISPVQELVVLMGNPGSGKSTTAKRFSESGYVVASRDEIESIPKMVKLAKESLSLNKSVVIDATHPSEQSREPFLSLFPKTRILWHVRDGRVFNSLREHPVPPMAYGIYSKHFEFPNETEVELVF